MKWGRLQKVMIRAWVFIALQVFRPIQARKLPPVVELKALTDFANANRNTDQSNGSNLGTSSWCIGFNPQGTWTGGNPCHGFNGLQCWSTGNIRVLSLPLSGLSGTMSPALGNLRVLTKLSLQDNRLSGDIPPSLAQLLSMKRLRLQGNQFAGSMPAWVQNMGSLEELTLGRNVLEGPLPVGAFTNLTLLRIVDISHNRLSGTIPDGLFRIPSLKTLLLQGNYFSGKFPVSLASSSSLTRADLSRNSLNGHLPAVWSTPNLTSLDLSQNNLSGPIPTRLLNLTNLTKLNLAHNNFVGNVSTALSGQFGCSAFLGNPGLLLQDLNCSETVEQETAPAASPSGDSPGPELSTTPDIVPPEADHHIKNRGLSTLTIVALTADDVTLLLMSAAASALFWIWWKKKVLSKAGSAPDDESKRSSTSARLIKGDSNLDSTITSDGNVTVPSSGAQSTLVRAPGLRPALKSVVGMVSASADYNSKFLTEDLSFNQSFSIDDFETDLVILDSTLMLEFEDLLKANALVLGAGSFGSVYMAALEDGHMFAIKRLEEEPIADAHAFGKQCTHLAEVIHPNLLQMRAYCWSPKDRMLIFDFMPNGSVHSMLHESAPDKDNGKHWAMRLKIAVGTARALAHLHDNDMVHGNIKGTNVLLDEHFEPRVSDFGLDALLQTPLQHSASAGYLAPELVSSARHKPSQDKDVYSFGVLLLELLTGLEPTQAKNNMDLPTWVQEMTSNNRTVEVFDPAMVSMHVLPAQDVLEFLELAQACVSEDARARPSITIVLRSLESIVPGSIAPRSYVQDDSHDPHLEATDNAFASGFQSRSIRMWPQEPRDD